jgi:hypothetical protein
LTFEKVKKNNIFEKAFLAIEKPDFAAWLLKK